MSSTDDGGCNGACRRTSDVLLYFIFVDIRCSNAPPNQENAQTASRFDVTRTFSSSERSEVLSPPPMYQNQKSSYRMCPAVCMRVLAVTCAIQGLDPTLFLNGAAIFSGGDEVGRLRRWTRREGLGVGKYRWRMWVGVSSSIIGRQ